MKKILFFLIFLSTMIIMFAQTITSALAKENKKINDVDELIAKLSLDEKIGQLMVISFGGTQIDDFIKKSITSVHAGAVALFSRNIESTIQLANFVREIHDLSEKVPLFIAIDQEGGNVVRIKQNTTILPSNMALGASRSPMLAYLTGQALATDLRLIGINMNFAPVLDVNSNPDNPVIGIRSFGEVPDLVSELGISYMKGLQENGVAAVTKHFPGHGDTQNDSHFDLPVLHHTFDRLASVELKPFQTAIQNGLDAIMTAHLALPNITHSDKLPATLSSEILTDILRKQFGFQGIIITDGLEMRPIIENYGIGKAAVMAIQAGADMILILWSRERQLEVFQALKSAVLQNEISEKRIDESLKRILTIKKKRGLFDEKLIPSSQLAKFLDNPLHGEVISEIAAKSITLVKNETKQIPFSQSETILSVSHLGYFNSWLSKMSKKVQIKGLTSFPTDQQIIDEANVIATIASRYDKIVFSVVNNYQVRLLETLKGKIDFSKVIVVSFGSPYLLSNFPEVSAYLCSYSYLNPSQKATALALFGKTKVTGKLPVTLPNYFPFGHFSSL